MNLWQYDEQELRFHDGRLILRGENGSGKSKALEVLLPFLLDADLSPHRLDPFQGQGRSMRWNLLEGGRHENRVGYVWLEFGRRRAASEGSGEVFVTLGCGLRASRRTAGVDAWYFLSEQRVGEELVLLTPDRQPLTLKQLRLVLGEVGTVYRSASEYRDEVDKHLYDLGADRFAALRHLLLQLRRPQLSEKLDPDKLSDLLTTSLPPIEEDLISELAELFERLAHHEKELARLRSAAAAVEAFLGIYRDYSRGVGRGRADAVRRNESRYQAKSIAVRATEDEATSLHDELTKLERRQEELGAARDVIRGEVRALEQSEAMKAAQALAAREDHTRTLEEQAARDERDAAGLAIEAEAQDRDHQAAREEELRRRDHLADPERRAGEGASGTGLDAVHESVVQKLGEDAVLLEDVARGSVRAAVRERREAAAELRTLAVEHEGVRQRFRRAEERRREADEQVRAAHERDGDARSAAQQESERLGEVLSEWVGSCRELELDDGELERLNEALLPVVARQTRGGGLHAVLGGLVTRRRDLLVADRTALAVRITGVEEERVAVVESRRRVAESRELGPEASRFRETERRERPGSPFYLLCDFADGVGESDRAGLEAALEAAGLLDAWVQPDGRLLDAETFDTVLVPHPLLGASRTLGDWLVPDRESTGVAMGVVEKLLASIAVGQIGSAVAAVIDVDGSYRLGPLVGRWTKPTAEHLGAAAREAGRRRRLSELDARLADLGAQASELETEDRFLVERLERLASEAAGAPQVAELERLRHAAAAAAADLVRRRGELTEAETAVAAARRQRDEARQQLEARAGELRLMAWLADLDGFGERLRDYEVRFEDLLRVTVVARHAALAATRAQERADTTRRRCDEATSRAARSRSEARSARAEVTAHQATVGVEVREVVERHAAAVHRREELDTAIETLRAAVMETREQRAVVAERQRHQKSELAELAERRREAANRLQRLVELGFLDLVLAAGEAPQEAAAEVPDEGSWSLRQALGVARTIARQTTEVDVSREVADRRSNRLMTRYRELEGEIGGDFQSRLDQEDELLVFRVTQHQRDHDGPELAGALRREIGEREGELAEDERELMRRILLGDVGDHLRGRLRQAHELVRRMNRLLAACPTASGMTLRLSWRPDEESASEVRRALELLLRDPELLTDDDRKELEGFFQARVDQTRREQALVPWREHLLAALDYRLWHRFQIERRMPGESSWGHLSRKSHAASSGGEKAVALHLPLFAAAAAHYESARPEAPRLILLDEAFAGIDSGMRGRCMALLVEFDLDFMMTSYDEWGCYEELPGVATYQLIRDPLAGGVEAIRFVWNGERLPEDDS